MGHYHRGCNCGCGRGVGGAYDRWDKYDRNDGVGGAYDRCRGDVGGTSTGGCGNVGGAYSNRGCGCGGGFGNYDNVGGAYYNRKKCCICYLVEPVTNFLRCLFSCNRRCGY